MQKALHDHDRIDQHHGRGQRHRDIQRNHRPEHRDRDEEAWPAGQLRQKPVAAGGQVARQACCIHQDRRQHKGPCRQHEDARRCQHHQQTGGQQRADRPLQFRGNPRAGKRAGIILGAAQQIGNDGQIDEAEGRRSDGKDKDQRIDLPDFCHQRQQQQAAGADKVQPDQQMLARDPLGQHRQHRGGQHIGQHLQRQGGADDGPRLLSRKIKGEQRQRHGGDAGPEQRDDIAGEQPVVAALVAFA